MPLMSPFRRLRQGKQEFKAGLCLKSMKTETKQLPFMYNFCEFTSIFIIIVVTNRILSQGTLKKSEGTSHDVGQAKGLRGSRHLWPR